MSGEGVKTEEEKAAEARRGPGANAAQRRGPMSMGMPAEKSKDFVPSAKRLLTLLRPERASLYAVLALAVASVALNAVGPKILGRATDLIFAGFVIGMLRLVLQAMHETQGVEWPSLIQAFVDINWLYFSFLLFVFTCGVIFVVSKFTPPASVEQIAGLTYKSVSAQQNADDRKTYGFWEIFHTCVVLAIIAAVYLYFW
jgi:hypothetical protein